MFRSFLLFAKQGISLNQVSVNLLRNIFTRNATFRKSFLREIFKFKSINVGTYDAATRTLYSLTYDPVWKSIWLVISLSQLMLARMTQRQERSTHSDRLPQLDRMWVEFAFIFRRFHEGFYPLDNNLSSNCQFDREKVDEESPQGFAFLHS